ncbi:MAG: ABC transporter substrate-binding protein [Oscillospiraceae bacterium]|nr:ABC transporter substrate-binding protein [Oscillospiraceae bacterium]
MKKKTLISALLIMLAVITVASAGCGGKDAGNQNAAEKTHIVFADVMWDSIVFHNAVAGRIAEEVFGYTWEEMSGSTPLTYESLLRGDIDVYMEIWTENLPNYKDDVAAGNIKELSVNFDDNKQGLYVPRYVIEGDAARGIAPMAPGLKTVEDLKNYPDVFKDEEDPSKGRVYGGPPGWEISMVVENKFYLYGLDEMFNLFQPGSDTAMSAEMVRAYDRGEALVAYYWEPTWLLGKYSFIRLSDVPFDPELFLSGACDLPAMPVMISASTDFYASNPEFCAFLEKYRTSSALTSEALAYIQDTGDSYEGAAEWFLKQHPELTSKWLTPEQNQKLTAALS